MAKRSAKRKQRRPKPEPRVQPHQAVWFDAPVPAGYWQYSDHRRLFMRWLGQRLGYRTLEDWYNVTTDDFKQNRGSGALLHCWNSSAIGAVKETFPDYDWKEWLFTCCPRAFWKDPKNHRRYMDWFSERMQIQTPEDWYRINNQDFRDNKGGAFLLHYQSTISLAIMTYLPKYDWQEWRFGKTPKGFWDEKRNRIRFMKWLGKQVGIKKIDDWYDLTRKDFDKHNGKQFIKFYDGSPLAAVKDCIPRKLWDEWRFARVPRGFWNDAANRRRYIKWLGKRMGFKKPADWLQIRRDDLRDNYGGGLVAMYGSYLDLLADCLPDIDWQKVRALRPGRSHG